LSSSPKTWKSEEMKTAGAKRRREEARSDHRLSRAGVRADINLMCGSRAGRATKIPPTSCHRGGGDARAARGRVVCERLAGGQNGWLKA